jgi:hypothetical protein
MEDLQAATGGHSRGDDVMKLPDSITAALDTLEAAYPTYSASAKRARVEAERVIRDALRRAGPEQTRDGPVLHLVR